MNRQFVLFLLIFFLPAVTNAQICKGRIVNAKTDEPIPFANVFLRSSSIGTISNNQGSFEFDCKGNTSLPLVVSCIGYQSVVIESDLYLTNLKILLEEKSYDIDEINVNGKPSAWTRRKMVKVFIDEFVGSTRIAKACEILNIDDVYLYYSEESKTLFAKCESPILIRNKSLGYNISFALEKFRWSKKRLIYTGNPSFQEHIFSGEKEIENIKKRRLLAYKGTLMNFFRTLASRSLQDSRFEVFGENTQGLSLADITDDANNPTKLCCQGALTVYYFDRYTASFLTFLDECIPLNSNGYFDPDLVIVNGFMATFRVGDMLPFDYVLED